jgi:hypothetical protein
MSCLHVSYIGNFGDALVMMFLRHYFLIIMSHFNVILKLNNDVNFQRNYRYQS